MRDDRRVPPEVFARLAQLLFLPRRRPRRRLWPTADWVGPPRRLARPRMDSLPPGALRWFSMQPVMDDMIVLGACMFVHVPINRFCRYPTHLL